MKIKPFRANLKRVKEILLPTVVIVVIPFLAGKFLLPKTVQTFKFHQQLTKNEAQVLSLEKKAAFLEERQRGTFFADFEKVEKVLPGEKDVAGLLVSLEGLKENAGLKLENLDLQPGALATVGAKSKTQKRKEQKRNEFEFGITFSGPLDSLAKFLEKIEDTAPLTSIEKAEFNFKLGREKVKANLAFKAYYLPLKEQPLNIERPLPELSSFLGKTFERILGFEVFTYKTTLLEEAIGKENPFSY